MPGKTSHEAVQNFVAPLQRAASCVTRARLNHPGGYYVREEPFVLTLGDGLPVRLGRVRTDESPLSLSFTMWYRVVAAEGQRGPWKVSTTGYEYSLDDDQGREVLAYHWHPESETSWADFPHLHIEAGAEVGRKSLIGKHLPTGRVAFEQVLWVAIHELGVKPLRADWEQVLQESLALFHQYRTWPTTHPLE